MPDVHTILLVEDNPTTRKLVRFTLERRGYSVLEAPDGRSAIALMAQKPDLVLQDIILPDMDGFALVSALRAVPGALDTPILAFSGYVSKLEEARISSVGFDDVITKPIEPTQLLAIIEARLPSQASAEVQFGAGRRLLIADDEPIQLKLSRFRLVRLGFEVQTASNGEEALALARTMKPDVIVSDVTMPGLDGFGLCAALRQEPSLAHVPLLLISSSYVEPMDRDLARRSGATDLLQRTPDLRALVDALRVTLLKPSPPSLLRPESLPDLERARARRALRQLERQVQLNTGLARRCSALAAELTVLAGLSETVVNRRDLNETLDEALAACFDAGGISVGALYLLDPQGRLNARTLGGGSVWQRDELRSFFGQERLLRSVVESGTVMRIPSSSVPEPVAEDLLARCGGKAALIMPLVYGPKPLGALVMVTKGEEFEQEDWQAFAQGVCNQITQVLTLAAAFAAKEAAERKASEHAALLSALIENAPDFVVHVDADGSIRFINRAFPGVSMAQIVGSSWLAYQQPEHASLLARTLASVILTGEPASYETTGLSADGTTTWYSARLGPIRREGVIAGAVLMLRDISDRKQAEAQLMLSDRMASVGTLAAGVAHEINNPLASVLANLELALRALAESPEPSPVNAALLHDAHAGAQRVQHIVRDLKVFSRSEEDTRGPVDVERVLESALRLASNEIRHRARLRKRYCPIPPVEANESRLGQVFLNLIVNAIQAIPEGRFEENEVLIETDMDRSGRVVVTVTDTGEGIPLEARQRIFTPFFTTKPIGVGTGLGLSICHRIVTSFAGSISFETETGKGTAFRVVLPASKERISPSSVESSAPSRAVRRGHIMEVDDDDGIGRVVTRIFEAEHEVTWVNSGRQALEVLEGHTVFDVILCDLMMPQMTGMDVYEQLRFKHPRLAAQTVFLTGGAFTTRAREFLDTTPNLRLEKPFDLTKLRALVNGLVR
jgi:PAS domain S-box-containing protein